MAEGFPVGGVGYQVTVTPRTLAELEPTSAAFLHIHHHIREDAQTLYGFSTREERTAFEKRDVAAFYQALLRRIVQSGASVQRFEMIQPSLHQIFLQKVSATAPPEERAAWAQVEEGMSGHG